MIAAATRAMRCFKVLAEHCRDSPLIAAAAARAWAARFSLLPAALAACGMAHVWLRTSTYGAALTGDSIVYLSVAESLAAGEGMHTFDGGDSALWPPLFPMLMAFASLFGLSLEQAGRFANILAFGLILLVSGL